MPLQCTGRMELTPKPAGGCDYLSLPSQADIQHMLWHISTTCPYAEQMSEVALTSCHFILYKSDCLTNASLYVQL